MQLLLLALSFTVLLCQTKGDWELSSYPDSNYSNVTCNFQRNLCGWKNLESNGWKIGYYYAVLDVSGQSPNFTRRLTSPWLQALPGYTCRLQFRYYINYNNRCSLTVIRQTESDGAETQIWMTTSASGFRFSRPISVQVECADARYRQCENFTWFWQSAHIAVYPGNWKKKVSDHLIACPCTSIIFEGKRLGDDPCGFAWDNEIDVDEIVYYPDRISTTVTQSSLYISSLSTTVQTSLPTTSIALSPLSRIPGAVSSIPEMTSWSTRSSEEKGVTENATRMSQEADGSNRGLDNASLAGIIVGVMAVLIGAAIFVIILLCLRRKNGKKSNHWLVQCFKKRPNLSARNGPRAVTNSAYGTDEGQVSGNAGGSVKPEGKYDSINVDTEADVCYSNLPGDKLSSSAAARAVLAYDNVDGRKGPGDRKTAGQGHLQDDNVYSLAGNDGISSAEEAAEAGTTHYDAVDNNDGFKTSSSPRVDEYNRLDIKGLPTAGDKQEMQHNHYNYLNDSVGTATVYNQLDHEDKLRNQQRELNSTEYNHI